MSKPVISICVRCDEGRGQRGEDLFDAVKKLRKRFGFKPLFDVDAVKCLSLCDSPCNVQFEGKKRSTYTRTEVNSDDDALAVVKAARAYALLEPGDELPERVLPGVDAD